MKRILLSLSIIGVVSAIAIGGTMAYFGDTETSTGNTFTAGSIDLKIDLRCKESGCYFPLKDLDGDPFFHYCDLKPGDSEEVTISWHVYDNNAWARMKIADFHDYEYGCTEPEEESGDTTCNTPGDGEGELDEHLYFTIWLDEGSIAGWQCPENQPGCGDDPQEGDNELNGIETKIVDNVPLSELIVDDWIVFPKEIEASKTHYVGVKWEIPSDTGNIIQTDSLTGKIVIEVVQSKNNPNPWQ